MVSKTTADPSERLNRGTILRRHVGGHPEVEHKSKCEPGGVTGETPTGEVQRDAKTVQIDAGPDAIIRARMALAYEMSVWNRQKGWKFWLR